MNWEISLHSAGLVLCFMSVLWVVSVFKKDASIVDPWWSILFLLIAIYGALQTEMTPGKMLLLSLVGLWSIRLWLHLLIRGWGEPEDSRYMAFRHQFGAQRYWWFSFFQVFMLQGSLAIIISTPLQLGVQTAGPDPVSWFDILGTALVLLGFGFETIADAQLNKFRSQPENQGKILNTGLWRYSRHPNYFGESVIWWGFWVCCLDTQWGAISVFSPALMTFLLLKVSGVVLLDKQLLNSKPNYMNYMESTSAFIPRTPRKEV